MVCVSVGAQEGRGRARSEGLERAKQRGGHTHKGRSAREAVRGRWMRAPLAVGAWRESGARVPQ